MDQEKCCGMCKWNRKEPPVYGEWICCNEDADDYSEWTECSYCCEYWEERNEEDNHNAESNR